MKLKKRLLIPLPALIVAALAGWAIHHWGGLSFWVAFGIVLGAIVINGFIAEAEDNAPGGFNNPLPLNKGNAPPKDALDGNRNI
jgi:hypothetical protein